PGLGGTAGRHPRARRTRDRGPGGVRPSAGTRQGPIGGDARAGDDGSRTPAPDHARIDDTQEGARMSWIRHRALVAALVLAGVGPAAAVTVTRGPYLQTPTPASMIVRWRTDTPTPSRVAYGAAPGALTQTADDPTLATEHVVTVSGLAADTQHYYSVGSVGGALLGDDADHWVRTAPPTGTPTAGRIWTIGDAGFTGANLDAVRDAYVTFNGSSAADLFVLLGDNAYL